jgi:cobalamin biosynthesis protein CobD/CbiB
MLRAKVLVILGAILLVWLISVTLYKPWLLAAASTAAPAWVNSILASCTVLYTCTTHLLLTYIYMCMYKSHSYIYTCVHVCMRVCVCMVTGTA